MTDSKVPIKAPNPPRAKRFTVVKTVLVLTAVVVALLVVAYIVMANDPSHAFLWHKGV